MSVKASTWAWEIEGLSIYQKMVLLRLADHANTEGFCYPGKDSLAAACCCSQRKVDEVVKELEQLGLIKIEARQKGGRALTNVYHLMLDQIPLFQDSEAVNPAQRAGVHSVQGCTPEQLTPHTASINPAQRAPESRSNHKEPTRAREPRAAGESPPWFRTFDGICMEASNRGLVPFLIEDPAELARQLIEKMQAAGEEVPEGLKEYHQQLIKTCTPTPAVQKTKPGSPLARTAAKAH